MHRYFLVLALLKHLLKACTYKHSRLGTGWVTVYVCELSLTGKGSEFITTELWPTAHKHFGSIPGQWRSGTTKLWKCWKERNSLTLQKEIFKSSHWWSDALAIQLESISAYCLQDSSGTSWLIIDWFSCLWQLCMKFRLTNGKHNNWTNRLLLSPTWAITIPAWPLWRPAK